MTLRRVVVATDESDAGRKAVRIGADLARRASAELTVMRTVPAQPALVGTRGAGEGWNGADQAVEEHRLRRWLAADVLSPDDLEQVETVVTFGLPGIEICRLGELRDADLLVLGRKPRSRSARLLLGDTADAVARRSRIPCLFVPPGLGPIRQLLVALDGTDRGMAVLRAGCDFAQDIGAGLSVVTVEPEVAGEPVELASALPVERSARLRALMQAAAGPECEKAPPPQLEIRRGPVVDEVLAAVETGSPCALVLGYHRGGPPGVIEAASTGRRLVHLAPCAVLTVPL